MNEKTAPEKFTFQAEIKKLLDLLSHSLYQNREIAIRELISNASDALDKFRFISLTDESAKDDQPLEIRLEPDSEKRVLAITDNGIGMTHDELIENIGTIAHSGSLDFLSKAAGDKKEEVSLIGKFGVGFYSAFMLADKVEVLTRSYQDETGYKWESDGTGSFTIEPEADLPRGTSIRLHLRKDLDEYTNDTRLKFILKKYSTFVPYPIKIGDELVNDQKPIWIEPKTQLTQEQYDGFYQYLAHNGEEAARWHLHLSSDSPFQFHCILYCPQTNLELMGFGRTEHGISLCAKRILVQNDNRDLLPEYLRFLYGLVDSADLPLNISRESLQDNTVFRKIKKVLTKRVLSHLASIAKDDEEKYLEFYRQFGSALREGIGSDFENRDALAKLLRFPSSKGASEKELFSLEAYLERAGEDQKQIYYLGGNDFNTIARNPNLEIFRKKGIEVFYLEDPMDEIVLSNLAKFSDHDIVSIDSSDVKLPGDEKADDESEETAEKKEETKEPATPEFEKVLSLFQEELKDDVESVTKSDRLTDSPCCLVMPEGAISSQLQKVLSMGNKDFPTTKRILEINPDAELIKRLCTLSSNSDQHDFIKQCGRQLFWNASLMTGIATSPEQITENIQSMMEELAQKRSPIIT
ncbi:molecular chaperone HtpG [Gimesia sp.]|uniref:molecular chaperone HtpG n=1 Tax=Gimesia sp. TaxID=2024833 RepID=UPI000C668CAE|nr:molecular chaperone HtpG [Gimesia sp.]MAX37922.1 molecular chaperone HtpG [Gimesia sp.]HAH49574.1 molecular chaperone HtpG [Planctomycetaceae bacterium]